MEQGCAIGALSDVLLRVNRLVGNTRGRIETLYAFRLALVILIYELQDSDVLRSSQGCGRCRSHEC